MAVLGVFSLTTILDSIFGGNDITDALSNAATHIGSTVADLIPIGIGITVILAAPGIVKRVIHAFM